MGIEDAPQEVRDRIVDKQTKAHQVQVLIAAQKFIKALVARAVVHDQSKFEEPEASLFNKYGPKLAKTTYGSDKYKQFLVELKPALDHHYAENRHHPEHFENGINGMNLIDLVEMFCDWAAATLRHDDGDLAKSVQINSDRFGLSDQLTEILKNSVSIFVGKD